MYKNRRLKQGLLKFLKKNQFNINEFLKSSSKNEILFFLIKSESNREHRNFSIL